DVSGAADGNSGEIFVLERSEIAGVFAHPFGCYHFPFPVGWTDSIQVARLIGTAIKRVIRTRDKRTLARCRRRIFRMSDPANGFEIGIAQKNDVGAEDEEEGFGIE